MKWLEEFRDPGTARRLLAEIHGIARSGGLTGDRPVRVMEVCGGHTHTIYRYGLHRLLPEGIDLVHGPGCPVCVLPMGRVDDAVDLALDPGVTLCAFGDVTRVPGSAGSLHDARARGADVRIVYSPADALSLAAALPDRQVVFLAVGFETTAPATAATILQAAARDTGNFSVLCEHVRIEPGLRALLDDPGERLDGFIGPGHVATVLGADAFDFVPADYRKPIVVTGFEPVDLLAGLAMLLRQLCDGRCEVENQYTRSVRQAGNLAARTVLDRVLTVRPSFEWRGLGAVAAGGHGIAPPYAAFDAERRFDLPGRTVADPRVCRCGDVLRGAAKPWECRVFGSACTPDHPIGTCMVSNEGACAAYWLYGRVHGRSTVT